MASTVKTRKRNTSSDISKAGQSASLSLRTCVGCGGQIHDQYILRVAPNLEWHAACLKCCQCQKFLDEKNTCFVREGKIFCKEDYVRLFGTKCDKCLRSFGASDFVMRAKNKIFHLECFRCIACNKQLVPGDEFALRPEGLFCKEDHNHTVTDNPEENNNNTNAIEDGLEEIEDIDEEERSQCDLGDEKDMLLLEDHPSHSLAHDRFADSGLDDLGSEKSPCSSIGGRDMVVSSSSMASNEAGGSTKNGLHGGHQQRRSRAGRVRTVLTEKQLSLLKSCYSANPRPDALMKEQLVEMTGLSPRVVRVWFQNKRCKDKKKMCLQKSKEGRKLGYSSMPGVPMVATSPMRHDMPPSTTPVINPVDIQGYEPPWKALCDFALNSDLDRPGYNHLVNEMHGYEYGGGRPPIPPQIISPNDLIPPYPQPQPGEPPYMDPSAGTASVESYTLTSLDTSNES